MAFSAWRERRLIPCLSVSNWRYNIRSKWKSQGQKPLLLWYWITVFCAGGSQPRNGHGWVWLYEQCDEMSVQIRWPQSVHVWVSCRWGQKNHIPPSHFTWSISPPLSLICYFFSSHYRWCIQCGDWRPVWAPEANHQQLCVAHPRAQYEGLPVGPRDYSGGAEVDGPGPLGP